MKFENVVLYIATNNKTGKKYFGKTSSYFTEEELQRKYHGSGSYWKKHLKKHGNDVTMKIFKVCSLNENDKDYVKPIALKFSEENDIVNSTEWANLTFENGLDGGSINKKVSDDTKLKIANSLKNKVLVKDEKTGKISKVSKNEFILNENLVGICKNRILTEEHKRKISPAGRKLSEKTKLLISESNKNKIVSEETKIKLKERVINDIWRKNISDGAKKRVRDKFVKIKKLCCCHCNKEIDISNFKRWHGDNCKHNPNITIEQIIKKEPWNKKIKGKINE